MKAVTVTYFLDVISSWCHWAEPAWNELQQRFADRASFGWKIALMDASGIPGSRAEEEWYYRRSGTMMRSPYMLNAGWYEEGLKEYLAPNAVAEAARTMGAGGDVVRIALARAGMIDGRKIGDWDVALAVASEVSKLNAAELAARSRSPENLDQMRKSTREFHDLRMTVRPSYLIENNIGDRATFSGLATFEPLAATVEAMLRDSEGYASYAAHHGKPPGA